MKIVARNSNGGAGCIPCCTECFCYCVLRSVWRMDFLLARDGHRAAWYSRTMVCRGECILMAVRLSQTQEDLPELKEHSFASFGLCLSLCNLQMCLHLCDGFPYFSFVQNSANSSAWSKTFVTETLYSPVSGSSGGYLYLRKMRFTKTLNLA